MGTSLHLQHEPIHSSLNVEENSEKQQITHYRTLKKTLEGGKTKISVIIKPVP